MKSNKLMKYDQKDKCMYYESPRRKVAEKLFEETIAENFSTSRNI